MTINRLHYLLIISLIGTSCMSSKAVPLATELPKERTTERENEVFKKSGEPASVKKVDVSVTPFFQDFRNHTLLWGISYFLHSIILCIIRDYFFGEKRTNKSPIKDPPNGFLSIIRWSLFNGFYVSSLYMVSKAAFLLFFGSFSLSLVLSLVLASWENRWRGQDEKKEKAVIPLFKVRFWRAFRFIFSTYLLAVAHLATIYMGLLDSLLLIYVIGFVHDYRKQMQQVIKKAIDEKQEKAMRQKSNSLATPPV